MRGSSTLSLATRRLPRPPLPSITCALLTLAQLTHLHPVTQMILFGAMVMVFEQGVYNPHLQQYIRSSGAPSPFYSMFNSMYWCMTTMTTVGYGDYFPENGLGYITGIMAAVRFPSGSR